MEIIFFAIMVISVISWIGGISGKAANAQKPDNSQRSGSYQRTGSYQKTGDQRTARSAAGGRDERFELKRNNLDDLKDRMNQAMQTATMNTSRPSSGDEYTRRKPRSGTKLLGGNNPLKKSSFHHHEESSAYILDEETESRVLWALNRSKMQAINNDFNQFVAGQHDENQRMMQECRSVER